MIVSLIVAMDKNRVIGRDNDLPWHLPSDLRYFKRATLHKPLIMGRKTYESIGRPLPKRINIIVSRSADFRAAGCQVVASIEAALAAAAATGANEAMLGGGAELYRQTLDRAERLYLTEVNAEISGGSAYFPPFDQRQWRPLWRHEQPRDARHEYAYRRTLLLRR